MNYIIFLLMTTFCTIHSARQMEDFLQANQYFNEQKFEQALETYQKISTKGPALWYNIAQCYLQIGNYLAALIATKKAQIDADPTILRATYTTLNYLHSTLSITPDTYLVRLARWSAAYCSLFLLQIIVLLVWFLCALSWRFTFLQKFLVRFTLLFFLILSGVLLCLVWWLSLQQYGIMIKESALYVGPDIQFNNRGAVKTAEQISVIGSLQNVGTGWYKIKTDQGSGWVPADTLEPIESTL